MPVRKMTETALMACVTAVCSWITVPFPVPFTMQTFAVFFSVMFLGRKYGLISTVLYILLGAAGLPVFSGFRGGIGHLLGPTGGYIIGFLLIGAAYAVCGVPDVHKTVRCFAALSAGLVLCYAVGTFWFVSVGGTGVAGGFMSALSVCVLPYVIPDTVKMVLAFLCVRALRRRLPESTENSGNRRKL